MKKQGILTLLTFVLKGIIVGAGAILPGISGGTLCVAFGMYQPILNLLSHPIDELKKNWKTLFSFVVGGVIGFVGLAGLVGRLMAINPRAVICVFVGFVIGTLPALWRDAVAKQERTPFSYASVVIGFIAVLAILFVFDVAHVRLEVGFVGFAVCGVLWGLSLVVPGFSASLLIQMLFGDELFTAMNTGIGSLSLSTCIPLVAGAAACMLIFAKPVSAAIKKWHGAISHMIIGAVLASIASAIPDGAFESVTVAVVSLVCIACGTAVSLALGKLCDKLSATEQKAE